MKRQKAKLTEDEVIIEPEPEIRSLLLEHEEYVEPALTQEELIELRWAIFGKCPHCHEVVKGYDPGPFNAKHYRSLQDDGIDALSGHKQTCPQKWLRA